MRRNEEGSGAIPILVKNADSHLAKLKLMKPAIDVKAECKAFPRLLGAHGKEEGRDSPVATGPSLACG